MNMNSKKKSDKPKETPLFKIDPETGRMIPLPRKWPSPNSANKVKNSEKKIRRMLTLKPLTITAADFEESPNRAKIRKTDNNSVRKELFHLPSKKSQGGSRPSLNNRRTLSRRSTTFQKVNGKKFKPCELSPLLDMEEVEDELINKKGVLGGYPFKTPSKPIVKFNENLKTTPFRGQINSNLTNIPKMEVTRATPGSIVSFNDSEFLELEKICCVEKSDKKMECESPVSSVCSLLEGTIINSSKKGKKGVLSGIINIQQNVINDIENMLIESNTAFEEYKTSHERNISQILQLLETDKKQYENLVELQDRNKTGINSILKELKSTFPDTMESDKENTPPHNRRSMRLLNKSPRQTKNAKLIVSPAVSKSKDLRKTTLTKNLVSKTQQYNIESPRIRKALDMYNSMRCEISVLATPKLDRNYLNESPRSTNMSRNLSRRVQNQCLLLQDTPIHK